MAIDPETRASNMYQLSRTVGFRGQVATVDAEALFRESLDDAIDLYREAIQLDESYVAAARNLGSALIVRGVHTTGARRQTDLAGAIMHLSLALAYDSTDAATLTNLGIAFFYDKQRDRAKRTLSQALTFAQGDAAPACNLEHIARLEGETKQTQQYSHQCQQLPHTHSKSAPKTHHTPTEHIQELVMGGTIPARWQTRQRSTFRLDENTYRLATYEPGITIMYPVIWTAN